MAFVGLAAVRNSASVALAIAEVLGVLDATPLNLPRRAQLACDSTPTLLVLDNFEQVLDAASLIADLLTSVASLRVLITSRAPLRVRGEREYAVGPLALDKEVDVRSPADLVRSPAARLFVERVRDVQPHFRLTAANGPTVMAICRRLDGLPLALELAAPWIKVLTLEDLLRRLTDDVLLSTAGPRDLPERQQTINATVAWSYQLLPLNEQVMFRRGRRGFWALATPSPNEQAPRSSINQCTTSETRQNATCVHASAPIGEAGRMRQAVPPRSIP